MTGDELRGEGDYVPCDCRGREKCERDGCRRCCYCGHPMRPAGVSREMLWGLVEYGEELRRGNMPAGDHDPDDGGRAADYDWLTARGWQHFDYGFYLFEVSGGFDAAGDRVRRWWAGVMIDQLHQTFAVESSDVPDAPSIPCPCRTRGQVRCIEAVFGLGDSAAKGGGK